MPVLIQKNRTWWKRAVVLMRQRIDYLRERLEGFFGSYRIDTTHTYTQHENELIDQSVELLRQFFPGNPGYILAEEDFESRAQAVEDLGNRLAELYELRNVEIIVTDDLEIFPETDGLVFGNTRMDTRQIYINANLLQMDDAVVLEHLVSTIIHELRHIMQFEIMTLENVRGVAYQRRKAWRYNFCNYIDADLDMEAYKQQPIEFDARNFTNSIWRKAFETVVQ